MATPKRLIAGNRGSLKKGSEERVRLLLVEDDELVAIGLATLLELEGYSVLPIERGLSVVEAAMSFDPDAVILDLSLPDIEGIEVFRRLRRRWPDLPVVCMSGFTTVPVNRLTVPLVRKPFSLETLRAALELRRRRAERPRTR